GKLVEGDANLLHVEDGIAGDLAAAIEVGRGGGWKHAQGRAAQALDLEVGQAVPFVDPALAGSPKPGGGRGCSAPEGAREDAAASADKMTTWTTSETLQAGSRCRSRARYRRWDLSLGALGAAWSLEAVESPTMLDEAAAVPLAKVPFPGLGAIASGSGMIEF